MCPRAYVNINRLVTCILHPASCILRLFLSSPLRLPDVSGISCRLTPQVRLLPRTIYTSLTTPLTRLRVKVFFISWGSIASHDTKIVICLFPRSWPSTYTFLWYAFPGLEMRSRFTGLENHECGKWGIGSLLCCLLLVTLRYSYSSLVRIKGNDWG